MAVTLLEHKLSEHGNQPGPVEMPKDTLTEIYSTIMTQKRQLEVIEKLSDELNEQIANSAHLFTPEEKQSMKPIISVCVLFLTFLALYLAKINQQYHLFPPIRRVI